MTRAERARILRKFELMAGAAAIAPDVEKDVRFLADVVGWLCSELAKEIEMKEEKNGEKERVASIGGHGATTGETLDGVDPYEDDGG